MVNLPDFKVRLNGGGDGIFYEITSLSHKEERAPVPSHVLQPHCHPLKRL